MFTTEKESLIIFIACVTLMLGLFSAFIIGIVYAYQKRNLLYKKNIEQMEYNHKNNLLQSQVEIQQQTFEKIAREIHDNIGQKLTLAKLYLNTIIYDDFNTTINKVEGAISLLSVAIRDLSEVSRGMGTQLILENGLVKALELELDKLNQLGIYKVTFLIEGKEVFLEPQKELILFRIVQEATNNIIKHANASCINVTLNYTPNHLSLIVQDDGEGISANDLGKGAGLINMQKRAATLAGCFEIRKQEKGTIITIQIPINETIPNV